MITKMVPESYSYMQLQVHAKELQTFELCLIKPKEGGRGAHSAPPPLLTRLRYS